MPTDLKEKYIKNFTQTAFQFVKFQDYAVKKRTCGKVFKIISFRTENRPLSSILTDYFALSDEDEKTFRNELLYLKKKQGIDDNEFYHYDTPLTVKHETEALLEAGFSSVEVLNSWGATFTLKAIKQE